VVVKIVITTILADDSVVEAVVIFTTSPSLSQWYGDNNFHR
jgi:hypothetical protein